ncbi:MAG: peptidyl-prolyl cis-trans isomerase [Verrucomicrobiales bacterium]|nr:peptidyl-prolyl cis-trans isomerase [Verrucomicrobiales bacterium]
MKKLIREPLVHFLLLGAALFSVYAALTRNAVASREDILVTSGQIENLAATFAKVWQRPPTAEELKAQIDQYVKEEILSREAMKLGLDQNDTVIRRRLQQKMEFIAEDFAAATEPTEAELADHLAKHPSQFAQEKRFTFRQVFLNPQKRGDQVEGDTTALLAKLEQDGAKADTSTLGDSLLLPHEFADEPQRAVAAQFGQEFAAGLAKLKPGEWSGPIQSGYGTHLVFVTARTEGRIAALDEVRDQVKRELMNARRLEANQKFLESLLATYRVTIQSPKAEAKSETKTTAMNR